jgi:hypothetical protein
MNVSSSGFFAGYRFFKSRVYRLWISFTVEFKTTSFPPVVIGGELP